jgi:hypothetical protein
MGPQRAWFHLLQCCWLCFLSPCFLWHWVSGTPDCPNQDDFVILIFPKSRVCNIIRLFVCSVVPGCPLPGRPHPFGGTKHSSFPMGVGL